MQNQHQQHIRLNDIALIHDENLPRLTWRKEIVVELLKGPDRKMREAEVKTSNGWIFKRPITKLFPIEYFECLLDENFGENGNEIVGDNVVQPERNETFAGEIRRQFTKD